MASLSTFHLTRTSTVPPVIRDEMWIHNGYPKGHVPSCDVPGLVDLPSAAAADVASLITDDRIARWWRADTRVGVRTKLSENYALPDKIAAEVAAWRAARNLDVPDQYAAKVTWEELCTAFDDAEITQVKLRGAVWVDLIMANAISAASRAWCADILIDGVSSRVGAAGAAVARGEPGDTATADAYEAAVGFAGAVFDAAPPGSLLRSSIATLIWQRQTRTLDHVWASRLSADPLALRTAMYTNTALGPAGIDTAALKTLCATAPPVPLLGWVLRWGHQGCAVANSYVRPLTLAAAANFEAVEGVEGDSELASLESQWPSSFGDLTYRWVKELQPEDWSAVAALCRAAQYQRASTVYETREWATSLASMFLDRHGAHLTSREAAGVVAGAMSSPLIHELVNGRFGQPTEEMLLPIATLTASYSRDALLDALWRLPELFTPELVRTLASRIHTQVWAHHNAQYATLPTDVVALLAYKMVGREAPAALLGRVAADPLAAAFWEALDVAAPRNYLANVRLLETVRVPELLAPDVAKSAEKLTQWAEGAYKLNQPTAGAVTHLRRNEPATYARLANNFMRCSALPGELRLKLLARNPDLRGTANSSRAAVLADVAAGNDILDLLGNDHTTQVKWITGRLPANQPTTELLEEYFATSDTAATAITKVFSTVRSGTSQGPLSGDALTERVFTTPGVVDIWAHSGDEALSEMICERAALSFGVDLTKWRLFAELAGDFRGTVQELVALVEVTALDAVRHPSVTACT